MISLFEIKIYVRGDVIYKEGDIANYIYLIRKGEVKISYDKEDKNDSS